MSDRLVILTLTRIEATHLLDLVNQFSELVTEQPAGDPGLGRLTPDVYPDDAQASREFQHLTRGELLGRRSHDASIVKRDLERIEHADMHEALTPVDVPIDGESLEPWLRTLAALRLVIASRLGVETGADHDEEDPRFGLYDWLGYRLEGLVQVAEQQNDN
ncbi:DUF2017 family protein [Microbacterium amylolyticum]|uniref:DUF2017 domain-containing protein n=1 Tax=Microbacterium amylolyticum TaxID=936337 RepID=A0ABS4ZEL1_9MICO|nr:DUF2017 family protein [Microbacterium amylolyticum]MBP2435733.1 hypothetical protein [Microbacterium amylolyticum]